MADTPTTTPSCAFCDWTGDLISQPAARVMRQLEQEAVLAHHVAEHGFPHQGGERTDWLVYFPDREAVVTVQRSLHGILVAYGDTVSVLSDDAPLGLLDHLTTVQTAVLSARLRSWADRLDERDVMPRSTS